MTASRRLATLAVAACALLAAPGPSQGQAASCNGTVVDEVWTGTGTRFGSTSTDEYAFIAYYDADRNFAVARVDLDTCEVERKTLPSVFDGWDSHNYTTLTIDDDELLHVSGNMHSVSLEYFRGAEPLDVATLAPQPMVGEDEARVTYPNFIHTDNGLVFLYRDGRAGDGQWFMNRWRDGVWERIGENPIFDADRDGVVASAYPTELEPGPDGFFHVAVVWRGDRGVDNDFRLSYAKTQDFRDWFTFSGEMLTTPLDPETMETIDDVGRNAGLQNHADLGVDAEGRPYVLYIKYTDEGRNGAFIAVPEGRGWRSELLAEAETTARVVRSNKQLPRASLRTTRRGAAAVVRFPGERAERIQLSDYEIEDESAMAGREEGAEFFDDLFAELDRPKVLTSRPAPGLHFAWAAQTGNNELRRACRDGERVGCNPPSSPLVLFVDG